jgi:molybdate transport system regulatory protein
MTGDPDPGRAQHRAHGGSRSHNRPPAPGPQEPADVTLSHSVRPAQRIWLQENGVRMFGPGTYELLQRVDETGSLNRAARDMAMSYSKAWRITREVEERLGVALFERRTGGSDGGGSHLTDEGRLLLSRFQAFTREAELELEALFQKHFGDLPYAGGEGPTES